MRWNEDRAIDAVNVNDAHAPRAMAAYQRSARSGQSTSSPWGAVASLDQAACDALLETKRTRLASTLKAENLVAVSIADAADVFGAQAAGHRLFPAAPLHQLFEPRRLHQLSARRVGHRQAIDHARALGSRRDDGLAAGTLSRRSGALWSG